MRLYRKFALLLLLLPACCVAAHGRRNTVSVAERPLAFVRVNVIPMTGEGILKNQTVVVQKGKIIRIGPASSVRPAANAILIDGRGKYLIPGLVDFHVHLRDPSELLSYLAYGITTVVHLSGPMENVPDLLSLRRRIAVGEVLGPNLYTTGRNLDGAPPNFPNVSTVVTTPDAARRVVAEQQRAGVDFIKVYNNLEPEVFRAVADEAHQRGLAVIGHIPRRIGRPQALQAALAMRMDMIGHSEELFFTYFYGDADSYLDRGLIPSPDRTQIPQVVKWLRESGTAVTANLSFVAMTARQLEDLESVMNDPEIRYLHPAVLAMWRAQNPTRRPDRERFALRERAKYPFLKELVRALQAGGVALLLGTDASAPGLFPGRAAHLELQEMVRAGLTPFESLAAGTSNAGRFINKHVRGSESFGTVEVGKRADLLLLETNPLADINGINSIVGVVVRGRWLTSSELRRMREQAVKTFRG